MEQKEQHIESWTKERAWKNLKSSNVESERRSVTKISKALRVMVESFCASSKVLKHHKCKCQI